MKNCTNLYESILKIRDECLAKIKVKTASASDSNDINKTGSIMASCLLDAMIKIWDIETGKQLNNIDAWTEYCFGNLYWQSECI
jgi:WD40 repeat protein